MPNTKTVVQFPTGKAVRRQALIADLVDSYLTAREDFEQAKQEMARCQAEMNKLVRPGRQERFTVFEVGETRVKAHTRKGYRAIRWRTPR